MNMDRVDGKRVHVVSFNVPWPADYGGVIDVFYKLRALHEQGAKIALHCFHYGRDAASTLNDVADEVHYYKRVTGLRGLSLRKPYIISSRRSRDLLANLQGDGAPILFEGLHCCNYLDHPALRDRVKAVRLHNIEWQYYDYLARHEKFFSIRTYLRTASRRLKKFERRLSEAQILLAISPHDSAYYRQRHPNVHYLPAFHANREVTCRAGRGDFVLYHGNLGVNENHEAAMYLLRDVFTNDFKAIIAGKDPKRELLQLASRRPSVTVIPNPSASQMQQLIADAHVHVLPTFQSTGIRLKLLNTLFAGRFVITNTEMVRATGLHDLCRVTDDANEMRRRILEAFDQEFTQGDIVERRAGLVQFDNSGNARALCRLLGIDV
jgi:hypothetical protein